MKKLTIELTKLGTKFVGLEMRDETGAEFSAHCVPFRKTVNAEGRIELTLELPTVNSETWGFIADLVN